MEAQDILGLDRDQIQLYRAIAANPGMSTYGLASQVSRSLAATELDLAHLDQSALISNDPSRQAWFARDPRPVMSDALDRQLAVVAEAQALAVMLGDEYATIQSSRGYAGIFEVIEGGRETDNRLNQLILSSRQLVRAMDKPPYTYPDEPNEAELAFLRRGGEVRAIYEPGSVQHHTDNGTLEAWLDGGEHARVAATVPTKAVIFDDDHALLPLRSPSPNTPSPLFVVFHQSYVLDALIAIFEQQWYDAYALSGSNTSASSDLDPQEAQILALMAAGSTDVAIAKQIGVSYRTLQRRIGVVMGKTQAVTRFQLGQSAASRGWI